MKFVLTGEYTDFNTYINAERSNRYMAAGIKRKETNRVMVQARKQQLTVRLKPVRIKFTWITKNERKDPDNVRAATKFILDGLVKAGVLYDDSRKWIKGFQDEFAVDKTQPRVEIEII